jgi:exonuclease SbcC
MRPLHIRVEGFSAYRGRVEVGFEDVDFFSLAGPTGSGKSSLIDAMIFALYGRVPRLGGNAVAPAITAGSDVARVSLDFEVDGVAYTAVRMAQRTPSGGASVKEARLQEGDKVLADGADDVTGAVEDLLRLRFDDFTRTVVLPQGEFARFLTATKSERQGLLRNLLGLDVYTRVRELARTRAAVATERADGARRSLEDLALATSEEREENRRRHRSLVELAETVTRDETHLSELARASEEANTGVADLEASLGRLESITPPDRLEELETAAEAARSAVVDAETALVEQKEELSSLRERLDGLPSRDRIDGWRQGRARLTELESTLERIELETLKTTAHDLKTQLDESQTALAAARGGLDTARVEHAAHALAANLSVGDPCPVCARALEEEPASGELAILEELETALRAAEDSVEKRRSALEEAAARVAAAEARREQLESQRDELIEALIDAPDSDSLHVTEEQLAAAERDVRAAEGATVTAEQLVESRREGLDEIADASRRVAKRLTEAQISVASLEPPVPESDDVVVQWKELLAWRDRVRERLAKEREELLATSQSVTEEVVAAREALERKLRDHGVEALAPYAVRVATAAETARAQVEADERTAEKANELAQVVKDASGQAAVAGMLAGHLKSNGFEQWLMSSALAELVDGANDLLGQLSGGGYSLHSDDSGTFSIVDHRNADEMRAVNTLSGGETFLVSLALALSLAETLAAKGGSGLDAIILDEGFGTLDDESLDTVASVLEELTGRGLMVGVITHVKELAARAPVRYEVVREPSGAKVRLVA